MTWLRKTGGSIGASLAVAGALSTAQAAWSAEPNGGHAEHVDFTSLPLPVIVDGRLVNYVFIVLRLTPRPGVDLTRLKEREPYVRDRLVRAAHTQTFTKAGDLTHVDDARIVRLVTLEADRLIGPRLLQKVEVASQTPQRRSGLSQPRAPRPIIP